MCMRLGVGWFLSRVDSTKGSSCLIALRRFVRRLISNENGSASVRDAERCLWKEVMLIS